MLINYRQFIPTALLLIISYWCVSMLWFQQSAQTATQFGDVGNVIGSLQIQLLEPSAPEEPTVATPDTQPEVTPEIEQAVALTTDADTSPIIKDQKDQTEEPNHMSTKPQEASAGLRGNEMVSVNYLQALVIHLNQHKIYPQRAQRRHLTGRVGIALTIDGQGRLLDYMIVQSSGHAILDNTIATMLQRATPFPAPNLPPGENQITLEVPIVFKMQ